MKQGHKGFTRTEMVVVIVGLALLLGLLGMGSPRDNARFSLCKMNLMQIGLANIRYAQDYNGRLCPGDFWNGTTIKYLVPSGGEQAYRRADGIVNLGLLLAGNYLPWPTSVNHVFFCPSDPWDRYTYDPGYPTSRDFERGWGTSGTFIDFGYTYRDSYDGGAWISPMPTAGLGIGARMEKVVDHAMVTDYAEWGYNAQWGTNKGTHDRRYNVLNGDGSVTQIDDRKINLLPSGSTVLNPKTEGLTNWILYGSPIGFPGHSGDGYNVSVDYLYFDAVDYILNKSYYDPPRLPGEANKPIPRWRR